VSEQLVKLQQAWTGDLSQPIVPSHAPHSRISINDISPEILSFYSSLGFPDRLIATTLGTSRRTITRRRTELGMTKRLTKHAVPQHDLEQVSSHTTSLKQPQLTHRCPN
jgi:hypothetical protein